MKEREDEVGAGAERRSPRPPREKEKSLSVDTTTALSPMFLDLHFPDFTSPRNNPLPSPDQADEADGDEEPPAKRGREASPPGTKAGAQAADPTTPEAYENDVLLEQDPYQRMPDRSSPLGPRLLASSASTELSDTFMDAILDLMEETQVIDDATEDSQRERGSRQPLQQLSEQDLQLEIGFGGQDGLEVASSVNTQPEEASQRLIGHQERRASAQPPTTPMRAENTPLLGGQVIDPAVNVTDPAPAVQLVQRSESSPSHQAEDPGPGRIRVRFRREGNESVSFLRLKVLDKSSVDGQTLQNLSEIAPFLLKLFPSLKAHVDLISQLLALRPSLLQKNVEKADFPANQLAKNAPYLWWSPAPNETGLQIISVTEISHANLRVSEARLKDKQRRYREAGSRYVLERLVELLPAMGQDDRQAFTSIWLFRGIVQRYWPQTSLVSETGSSKEPQEFGAAVIHENNIRRDADDKRENKYTRPPPPKKNWIRHRLAQGVDKVKKHDKDKEPANWARDERTLLAWELLSYIVYVHLPHASPAHQNVLLYFLYQPIKTFFPPNTIQLQPHDPLALQFHKYDRGTPGSLQQSLQPN